MITVPVPMPPPPQPAVQAEVVPVVNPTPVVQPQTPVRPRPPAPTPVEPIPEPQDTLARSELSLNNRVTLEGESVKYQLLNDGPALRDGVTVTVEVSYLNRDSVVRYTDRLRYVDADYSGWEHISTPGLYDRFPRLAERGGDLEIVITVDPDDQVREAYEDDNSQRAVVHVDAWAHPPPPPINPPPYVPPPPPVRPEPAPTSAKATFRPIDGVWAEVVIDGKTEWEPRSFDTEKAITLSAGKHRVAIKSFMGDETWSEGTLTVTGGEDLVIGFAEDKQLEVYNDPGAFRPL